MFLNDAQMPLPTKLEKENFSSAVCGDGGMAPQRFWVGQCDGRLLSGPTWVSPVMGECGFQQQPEHQLSSSECSVVSFLVWVL